MVYKVVAAFDREGLEKAVSQLIYDGWACVGGVEVIHYDGDPRRFYQAMIFKGK